MSFDFFGQKKSMSYINVTVNAPVVYLCKRQTKKVVNRIVDLIFSETGLLEIYYSTNWKEYQILG